MSKESLHNGSKEIPRMVSDCVENFKIILRE